MSVTFDLRHGDCRDVLRAMPNNSIDSIVTDAPYVLDSIVKRFGGEGAAPCQWGRDGGYARMSAGFMGQRWDVGEVVHDPAFWAECLRVIKPGGWLFAFSGTRTQHRQTCAIEDAGWEIRDQIQWMFGTGMPKGEAWTVHKAYRTHKPHCEESRRMVEAGFAGWARAGLKPAQEPICVARKPLERDSVAENMLAWSVGALNVNACRIDVADAAYARNCSGDRGHGDTREAAHVGVTSMRQGGGSAASGRWPANVMHDGSAEVLAAFDAYGERKAGGSVSGREPSTPAKNVYGDMDRVAFAGHADTGSAARFFFSAKASRQDREEGCYHLPKRALHWSSGDENPGSFQSEGTDKSAHNFHPTVKPTELMRWLCRLATPPGGTVFDPFMGSGSTGKACALEDFSFVGCDLDPAFVEIAHARVAFGQARAAEIAEEARRRPADMFAPPPIAPLPIAPMTLILQGELFA